MSFRSCKKNKKSGEEDETMSDHLARAEDFESRADKKLTGWGLFGSKYEDAADLFDKAANAFKLAKSCTNTQFRFYDSTFVFSFR